MAAGSAAIDSPVLRADGRVTYDGQPLDIDRGRALGLAIDVGTTTVVIELVDLESGAVLGVGALDNPQGFGGSDVMNRISYDGRAPGELRRALARAINLEIRSLCRDLGFDRRVIYEALVVGNAVMRDCFFGVDVQPIGQRPYKSTIELEALAGERPTTVLSARAHQLGLWMHPQGMVVSGPLIASHVGADVAADLVAIGAERLTGTWMLVDVGTNTEVVVGDGSRLVAASCPAGPAFEGGLVRFGMPGADGAIERVHRDGDGWRIETIGGIAPEGICGSGLIDLLAELRRNGLMTPMGVFADRAREVVVEPDRGITLSRADASNLAQAKAANACGQAILLRRLGLAPEDIDTVFLAGGFREPRRRGQRDRDRVPRRGQAGSRAQAGQRVDPRRAAAPAVAATAGGPRATRASDRARRAGDHAGLLRAVRRGLPVQADAGGRVMDARPFIVIGENIHTTRVLSRSGRHVVRDGDDEWLTFTDVDGIARRLPVPQWHRETQEHAAGRLKHVAIAVRTGMAEGVAAEDAMAYLRVLAQRQVDAGAAYLDLNVDELSPRLADQKAAIRWLVDAVQGWTDVPVSIDSSHEAIIGEGLAAARPGSRPMLNSASLERRSALDLAVAVGGPVVVTAAGASGMPSDAAGRIANASAMVEAALAKGIAAADVFVDPLIFPVSVDGAFGSHALDAIRAIRARFGPEIHITGGMSNVSFGIPGRRLLNEAFLRMAIEAGADSGIIDPLTTDPRRVMTIDIDSGAHAMARDAILGVDANCRAFLRAYRAGEFAEYGIVPPARKAS